ncbi:MAG: hypothetical protein ABIH66_01455, partial [bacterium]
VNSSLSEFQNALRRNAENLNDFNRLIDETSETTSQQVQSTLAPIREHIENQLEQASHSLETLSNKINEVERELEAQSERRSSDEGFRNVTESRLEELKKSIAEMESIVGDVEELKAKPGPESLRGSIEEQKNSTSSLSEKIAELEEGLETAREITGIVDQSGQEIKELLEAQDDKISAMNEKVAELERLKEQPVTEEPAGQTIELIDRGDRELRELLEAQDDRISAMNEKVAELERLKEQPVTEEPAGQTIELIDRGDRELRELLEAQDDKISAMKEKIAKLEKREASPSGDSLQGTAAIIEEHIGSLRREFEERLRAVDSAVGGAADSVAEELKAQVQSGAWRQAIRESQIEFLRKTLGSGRESEAAEKEETSVTDEEAVDVYGNRIAGKLMGKRVSRDIFAGTDLIIQKGRIIDDSVIETAKVHGKFIELSLSVLEE